MKNYVGVLSVLLLMLAGCAGNYSDEFITISDQEAVLGWKENSAYFGVKGKRSARADSQIYEELYEFKDGGKISQFYLGMYQHHNYWDRNRSKSNITKALLNLPVLSNAKDVSYFESYRTAKTVKLYIVADGQECAAFIDRLQLASFYSGGLLNQYRTQVIGINCEEEGRSANDSAINKLRNSYEFKADSLYDGSGL